jgi:hypothetical protein
VKTPQSTPAAISKDDIYNIILQPEIRLICQEQLVADVEGVAGFVMGEAACMDADNKQATLTPAPIDTQYTLKLTTRSGTP